METCIPSPKGSDVYYFQNIRVWIIFYASRLTVLIHLDILKLAELQNVKVWPRRNVGKELTGEQVYIDHDPTTCGIIASILF
jgi:hypothetical protein